MTPLPEGMLSLGSTPSLRCGPSSRHRSEQKGVWRRCSSRVKCGAVELPPLTLLGLCFGGQEAGFPMANPHHPSGASSQQCVFKLWLCPAAELCLQCRFGSPVLPVLVKVVSPPVPATLRQLLPTTGVRNHGLYLCSGAWLPPSRAPVQRARALFRVVLSQSEVFSSPPLRFGTPGPMQPVRHRSPAGILPARPAEGMASTAFFSWTSALPCPHPAPSPWSVYPQQPLGKGSAAGPCSQTFPGCVM